ncbi:MAG TPA: DUF3568 family protein [Candidatus Sumerlaeota bacterium]|nr:DUF3568 family protein [Candidatus Sumerlaeota bacterium]HPK03540.1 DUF3568 family protein [Candidatus Sumerlaeota bacterium]
MKRLTQLAICLLIPCLVAGCSWRGFWTGVGLAGAAGAGAAAVYYAKGDLEADLDDDLAHVHKAAHRTLLERGYDVKENELDALEGRLVADIPGLDDEKNRSVKILTERTASALTHISIRVGTFGDEDLSRAILDDIGADLTKSDDAEISDSAAVTH